MRHVQLVVATAAIGPRPLPLSHGTLQVVERVGGVADGSLDWEVVLHTIEQEPVANDVHGLGLDVIVGADDDGGLRTLHLTGPAIHVRSVERGVVFRGAGSLDGFDLDLLG